MYRYSLDAKDIFINVPIDGYFIFNHDFKKKYDIPIMKKISNEEYIWSGGCYPNNTLNKSFKRIKGYSYENTQVYNCEWDNTQSSWLVIT